LERKIRLKNSGAAVILRSQSQTTFFANALSVVVDVRSTEANSGIWPTGLQDLRRRRSKKAG
jgi:hypothetical protein